MVYRNKKANDIHQGKWNGLGGKFEPGESPEELNQTRGDRKNLGFVIRNRKLHGLLMFPNFQRERLVRVRLHGQGIRRRVDRFA